MHRLKLRSRQAHPVWHGTLQIFALLVFAIAPCSAASSGRFTTPPGSAPSLALARYVASAGNPSPFRQPGTTLIEIEAALPNLYKHCRIVAVRTTTDSTVNLYGILAFEGDILVAQELVAPYFDLQDQIERLPQQSLAITPANYRIRYIGDAGKGPATAHLYRITPRKKRLGLIDGKLWIDAETGAGVLETGRFAKVPREYPSLCLVRETALVDGITLIRTTHVTVENRRTGRGELTIRETRLPQIEITPRMAPEAAWRLGSALKPLSLAVLR